MIEMKDDNEIGNTPRWPALAFPAVLIVWVLNCYFGYQMEREKAGQFGDMFGAVNALFSGFAFAGVFYAIIMQRYEIGITRIEIENTKKILNEQQKQLDIQNSSSKIQAFENTFFRMFSLFMDITENIEETSSYNDVLRTYRGKGAITRIISSMYTYSITEPALDDDMIKKYDNLYNNNDDKLGHYFRILFNIFNFIDSSDIENKKFYAKIVRAQLSNAEVTLLFFNCLSERGVRRFKPLVEKYGLLKNLNEQALISVELKQRYADSAYGNSAPERLG